MSRIESGEVAQPSADTLISLARALDRNPAPLLIVSGHIDAREARMVLLEMFRPNVGDEYDPTTDSELVDEWTHSGRKRETQPLESSSRVSTHRMNRSANSRAKFS